MAAVNFDVQKHEVADRAIPSGRYTLQAESVEWKLNKQNAGGHYDIKFRVLGPTRANFTFFQKFNTENPSEEAQRIGRDQFTLLSRACGITALTDTDELLNKPFQASLANFHDGYKQTNKITTYLIEGQRAGKPRTAKQIIESVDDQPPF
jgi:hypothetical protein